MKLAKVVEILEKIAPPELADEFDEGRIGLILDLDNDIKRVAVSLDATIYVLEKAAEMKADLLVTHHTLIFHPINKISKPLAKCLKLALENEISLYSMHTNYDRAEGGINDVLASKLGLRNIKTVEIGRTYNALAEITSGLEAGEMIITVGYQNLTDGALINVKR